MTPKHTKMVTRDKEGFTLIEIIIILLVLAIISSIAIPKFANMAETATMASEEYTLGAIREGINLNQMEEAVN